MKRHNYLQSRLERLIGTIPGPSAYTHLRRPLAAIGAAFALVAGAWFVDGQRVAALDRDLATLRAQATLAAADAARARTLLATVTRARTIAERVVAAHRIGVASTNAVAQVGNVLPRETWLTNVSAAPAGNWSIAGRSARLAEIGTTLRSIQRIDARAATHLVSLTATGRTGRIHDFVIAWDRLP